MKRMFFVAAGLAVAIAAVGGCTTSPAAADESSTTELDAYGYQFDPDVFTAVTKSSASEPLVATKLVNGRVTPEAIQNVIHANAGAITGCYEDALRSNPHLAGELDVKFEIDQNGVARSVSALAGASDIFPDTFSGCIVASFEGFPFPGSNGRITVAYPIVFHLEK